MAFQQLSADTIATAQQLDYVAFTARYPFTDDAYTIGFAPGFRVDVGYQLPDSVDLPVCFLDHDFRNPNRSQLLDAIHTHRPDVAVVGDAYDAQAATELQALVDDLRATYPDMEPIIVPKCRDAFDAIDQSRSSAYQTDSPQKQLPTSPHSTTGATNRPISSAAVPLTNTE